MAKIEGGEGVASAWGRGMENERLGEEVSVGDNEDVLELGLDCVPLIHIHALKA